MLGPGAGRRPEKGRGRIAKVRPVLGDRVSRFRTVAALVLAVMACALAPASASAQFTIGLQDPYLEAQASSAEAHAGYGVMRAIAGSTVRVNVAWVAVAPAGRVKPAGFNPANPGDPAYQVERHRPGRANRNAESRAGDADALQGSDLGRGGRETR